MSDNPNDQSQRPPDPRDQNQPGRQPYQQPYDQPPQPPNPGQVYYPQGYQPPPQGYQQPPPGYQQPPPGYQQPGQYNQNQADTGSNSGAWGWIIFILIFGVGNLILYSTTGWFIIPIPRR